MNYPAAVENVVPSFLVFVTWFTIAAEDRVLLALESNRALKVSYMHFLRLTFKSMKLIGTNFLVQSSCVCFGYASLSGKYV